MAYKYFKSNHPGYAPSMDLYSNTDGLREVQLALQNPTASAPSTVGVETVNVSTTPQVSIGTAPAYNTSPAPSTANVSLSAAPPPPIATTNLSQNPDKQPVNVTVINPTQAPNMEPTSQAGAAAGAGKKELFTPCLKCFIIGVVVGAIVVSLFKKKKS